MSFFNDLFYFNIPPFKWKFTFIFGFVLQKPTHRICVQNVILPSTKKKFLVLLFLTFSFLYCILSMQCSSQFCMTVIIVCVLNITNSQGIYVYTFLQIHILIRFWEWFFFLYWIELQLLISHALYTHINIGSFYLLCENSTQRITYTFCQSLINLNAEHEQIIQCCTVHILSH